MWARTHFVLKDNGVGIPEAELVYSGFDGLRIHLKDGRYLVPLRYHLGEKIGLAPIDNDPSSDAESEGPSAPGSDDPGNSSDV